MRVPKGKREKLSRFPPEARDRQDLGERDQERGKKSRLCEVGSWVWGLCGIHGRDSSAARLWQNSKRESPAVTTAAEIGKSRPIA